MAEAMSAAEVPADLMLAAELAAYEVLKQDHRDPPAMWMALVHRAVAAVLAAMPPLTDEYGMRITYVSTHTAEGAIADTLAGALEALAAFDAQGRKSVLSRTLRVRKVGQWQGFEEAER